MKKTLGTLAATMAAALVSTSVSAGTLDDVRARGELNCIVNTSLVGFAYTDENGTWRGFDTDFCRASAAAVLGDGSMVKFVPTTTKTRFTALSSGEGDVLYRNTTITMSRDADLKLSFLGVNYYDGQGFMIPASLGVSSARDLDGASVCVQAGTTTELNLSDFFAANNISYEPIPVETNEEAQANYIAGRCDVYTTDRSGLAATRSAMADPAAHAILPEIISKEPLGPAVAQGDEDWADAMRWVMIALIAAEELGITQANVADMAAAPTGNANIDRLLGTKGDFGAMIGLDNQWAVRAIAAVGNYGEIFSRNLGLDTPIGLDRGLNAQWTDGGLLYADPIR